MRISIYPIASSVALLILSSLLLIGATSAQQTQPDSIYVAGLYDLENFPWAEELIHFTAKLLNDHNNGWFDEVLVDTHLNMTVSDSACDQRVAVRAFLEITGSKPLPDAILGCRCSDPTMAAADLASIGNIAMLSPAASASKLSNTLDYDTFSRLAGPDNELGQVGAIKKLLRYLGWDRIHVIHTQTPFGQDFKTELSKIWEGKQEDFTGEIQYTGTVQTYEGIDKVDENSVRTALEGVPVDDPKTNSKVIVLVAHHHHAFDILKIAQQMQFQPDTIWIGVDAWTGREPKDNDTSWMPEIPGYIGVAPYRDLSAPSYQNFLERLQSDQRIDGRNVSENLSDSADDRTVDSIVALAMAFSNVPPEHRHNGTIVSSALREVKFQGVSGLVEFNNIGDWVKPKYLVYNMQKKGGDWIPIGDVTPEHANIDASKICYALSGCGQTSVPSEKYKVPLLDSWKKLVIGLSVVIVVLVIASYAFYRWYPRTLREKVKLLEEEIEGISSTDDAVHQRKGRLYREMASLLGQPPPAAWLGGNGLVDIAPTEQEYWDILNKMRKTVGAGETCHITKLSRVQNEGIWSYYVFRKNQLANKHSVEIDDLCEEDVWHGTSSLNPDVIYKDQQDGFMINYSQQGLYGRGIYFADKFSYSDCYSYRVDSVSTPDSSDSFQEDRELFLVKLLVGKNVTIDHAQDDSFCRSLVTPPEMHEMGGLKYDTVTGKGDCDTKIHVVYENGRAFPQYLIRYYKGTRDPSRTPFETQAEANAGDKTDQTHSTISTVTVASVTISSDANSSDGNAGNQRVAVSGVALGPRRLGSDALWMYFDDDGQPHADEPWSPCDADLSSKMEAAYQVNPSASVTVENEAWRYKMDLGSMTQTNLDHPGHRRRSIKRVELE